MPTTSASLLNQLRSHNDAVAWSRFAELYTPLVYRWVGQLNLQGSDQADVVQEVFVVLLGKLSTFHYDPRKSFRRWLRTVTINKTRDFLRRSRRESDPRALERIEQAERDEIEILTEQEYHLYLSRAALKLMRTHFSETTWRACWEHVAEGRSAKDVAESLGISENAVYLARGRVLKRLRDELQGLWE